MFQHLGSSAPQNWKITIATLASRRIFTTEASEQPQIESPSAHPLFSGPPLCCLSISQNIDKYPMKYTKRLAKKDPVVVSYIPTARLPCRAPPALAPSRTPACARPPLFCDGKYHRIYGRFMENVETFLGKISGKIMGRCENDQQLW